MKQRILKSAVALVLVAVMAFGALPLFGLQGLLLQAQAAEFYTEPMVAANNVHAHVLKNDGTVWSWGSNYCGELGDGTGIDRLTPVQVTGLTSVTAISAGKYHTVALKSDGTVWAWGVHSEYDQLDDEIGAMSSWGEKYSYIPMQVKGLTNVVAVSAGFLHTVALKSDGTVWAWGYNWQGQLGNGYEDIHTLKRRANMSRFYPKNSFMQPKAKWARFSKNRIPKGQGKITISAALFIVATVTVSWSPMGITGQIKRGNRL